MKSKTPELNLGAVLRETGLKADTLRAWERRYGLPQPQRTSGGQRLYSEYDIETLKWLKARLSEGLSISRAVELWQQQINSGRDPLTEYSVVALLPTGSETNADLETLRSTWLVACLAYNERQAEAILNLAFALYPVEAVCTGILQQGLSTIGEYWYAGKCTPQQEHFASALVIRHLGVLINATPAPIRASHILVGCPAGERHSLPALFISLYLRRAGYPVTYLGADIPTAQFQQTIAAIAPNLVILTAQRLATAAALRSTVVAMHHSGVSTAYGGQIFTHLPHLRERIPAYYLGDQLDLVVSSVAQLLSAQESLSDVRFGEIALPCARLFKARRALVEIAVFEELEMDGVTIAFLEDANRHFGNALEAALDLGDLSLLEEDLRWLNGLLSGHRAPRMHLLPYLEYYSRAVARELGSDGEPIVAWFASYLARRPGLNEA